MTRNIPGLLDYSKLMPPPKPAAASVESLPYDQQARHDFMAMDHEQQRACVQHMAASGTSDHSIAAATGLSTEMVRRILAEQQPLTTTTPETSR